MGKMLSILCIVILLLPGMAQASEVCGLPEAGVLELKSEAAFLLDLGTGKVLYENNADLPLFPASTTKIMTALILLENARLNDVITVGEEINRIGHDSSTAKLKVGDRLTVADMVYALMLPSGNDAAYATAVFVGRKVSGFERMKIDEAIGVFVELMNRRARELGAVNTHFVGPDGYHDPEHVTTARDLSIITLAALEQDFLCQAVAAEEYFWQDKRWPNTNRLVRHDFPEEYYPWATGFKTGYTPEAGNCFVFTASGGGRDLLGITLKAPKGAIWEDARTLLEYGFGSWQNYVMLVEGRQILSVPVHGQRRGQPDMLQILAGGTYSDLHYIADIRRLELNFDWARGIVKEDEQGLVLKAPIRKGQVLGMAVISLDGEILAEVEMVAAYDIEAFNWLWPAGAVALGIVLLFLFLTMRRKRARQAAG
ncbi:MAG: D-alanyl-D-alanine carboxypeptidase family protein [Bacillota bacterium]|jgi:D-alanyl-D-alanine carboxypeptidase (penicillin-binding protein 5/6)